MRGRIWQCGRAPPPRHVVPGLGPREAVPRARLSRRSPAGPARDLGDPQCAGGVPVHRVGNPARHLQAAEALGANVTGANEPTPARILADRIAWFMERLGVPNGLKAARLHVVRHPRPRRGHVAAASRDKAVAATRRDPTNWPRSSSTRWWRGEKRGSTGFGENEPCRT